MTTGAHILLSLFPITPIRAPVSKHLKLITAAVIVQPFINDPLQMLNVG
jgi:hypothetical protein